MNATPSEHLQPPPLTSLEEEVVFNLIRTVHWLAGEADDLFRAYDLSPVQHTVLRALRDAGPGGLGRNELRDRLPSRMPDVSRLLDRMEESGLVQRTRSGEDRRYVPTLLTERGSAVLATLEGPVRDLQRRQFGHVPAKQLRQLIETLTLIRRRPDLP